MSGAPQWGACGARSCTAKLRYVTVDGVGQVPVDVALEEDGPLVPAIGAGGTRVAVWRRPGQAGRGFVPHWNTCPEPALWQAERDRLAGRVPGAPGRRRGQDLGRCAGCRRPDHVAYGPDSPGPLCPGCAAILAAWRASPVAGRGVIGYPRWRPGGPEKPAGTV